MSHPGYRPDIDGLRAVAVLSVVAFHAFPVWLKGGFIGVDIFFVISGFLISTIIFESLDKGTFSFAEFYARRIRRIFPALLLVLLASHAFGWYALLADEYKQLGKHVAAGAGFVANVVLWKEAGYFDNAAETKPLLHLWSLGIEEQFYIVWPLLLWFAWKRNLNLMMLTLGLALASFYWNIRSVREDSVAAFFLPLSRFWELLCGAALAWWVLHRRKGLCQDAGHWRDHALANLLSFLGCGLLALGFWQIRSDVAFPGMWAAVPVLGALLVLMAGPRAWINRKVLSSRPAVWFGLISYPLYLWHWPLLSFARVIEGDTPGRGIRMAAVALAIVLAWVTYRYVERPIRFGARRTCHVAWLAAAMLVVAMAGGGVYKKDGAGNRFAATLQADQTIHILTSSYNCDDSFPVSASQTAFSCLPRQGQEKGLAVIGDSHAYHLISGIGEVLKGRGGIFGFSASCAAPYLNISSGTLDPDARKFRENAYKLINSAYAYILDDERVQTVVLAHAPTCSYDSVKDHENPEQTSAGAALESGMRRTFSALVNAHKRVIVLLDNPHLPFDPSLCSGRPFRLTEYVGKCSFPRDQMPAWRAFQSYETLVRKVVKDYPQVQIINALDYFCDDQYCHIDKDGVVLYKDRDHLNADGSRYMASFILEKTGLPD